MNIRPILHHHSFRFVHAGWVGDARNRGPVRSMLYTRQMINGNKKDGKIDPSTSPCIVGHARLCEMAADYA